MSDDWPTVPPGPDDPRRVERLSGGGRGGDPNLTGGGDTGDHFPSITSVVQSAADEVTISGTNLGEQTVQSQVTFTTGTPGAVAVASPSIREWSDDTIRAAVPALDAGGAVTVSVRLTAVRAISGVVVWPEASPPSNVAVTPADCVAGDAIVVTGTMFGYPRLKSTVPPAGMKLQFDDGPNIATAWSRTRIDARVPTTAGPGAHTIKVNTPWGIAAATVVVHAPATITSITPPTVVPDGVVTIAGANFGAQSRGSVKVAGDNGPQVAEIVSWSDGQIQARIPGRVRLGWGPGLAAVTVETGWGPPPSRSIAIGLRPSITTWARIEPHQRSDDLQDGLRLGLQARVYDAAWLLSTQWRLREYELEDAASPVAVSVEAQVSPIVRWRAPDQNVAPLAGAPPLETLVEREPRSDLDKSVRWSRRLAVEAGLQFLRMVAAAKFNDVSRGRQLPKNYLDLYPVTAPAGAARDALDPSTRRFLEIVAGRALDGGRLHVALRNARPAPDGTGTLPAVPKIVNAADRTTMLSLIAGWYRWCDSLLSEGRPTDITWDRRRNEYTFAVSADTAAGEATLAAREYDGGKLDWFDFVLDRSASLRGTGAATPTKQIALATIPAPVTFAGMPARRWWEFEDAQVDFGGIDAGPADLGRLFIVEFATVYGNDWFVVPLPGVTAGSLVRVTKVEVTNTFGDKVVLGPLVGNPRADGLHLFELSAVGASAQNALNPADLLFLPATVPPGLESVPIEQVDFVRDEAARMAWGVERVLESPIGAPYDQAEAYAAARQRTQAAQQPGAPIAPLVYRLRTDVPPFWIPFVPVSRGDSLWLHRAAMPDASGVAVPPRGRILEGADLDLYDEEVPREGAQVTRSFQFARASDGMPFLWLARRRRPGARLTPSGLRFDSVDPS